MAHNFLDLIRKSQLIEEDRLEKFLAELRDAHGGGLPEPHEKLAAALVEGGILTQWQVDKLLAGKHKGFILGKYKLQRQLGKGGMSTVYLAEHMLMKRLVAVKVLPQSRVEDSSYLERFRIEARAAAKLDDPNIVRAYDIDSDVEGKTHYLVMEYVEGQDLHIVIKENGPLDYEAAADYIAQVASGLSHAHEQGLVHRDIKPANCLLDKNKTVKLLDMGLARLIGDEASLTLDNNENVLGTADYLAPEQALDSHNADLRADIYSLGCTLYYLLTGHPPFPDGSISERLLKHQIEEAPSILQDRPDAPPSLVNICTRMMAKKPEARYQTADEVAQRLREWLADRGYSDGDSSTKSGSGSDGPGSNVFRRFAESLGQNAESSATSGLDVGSMGSSAGVQPIAAAAVEMEEDIGLAPLDEDAKKEHEDEVASDGSGSSTDELSSAAEETFADEPRRSLIEEELEAVEQEKVIVDPRFVREPGDVNPLRPPGFSAPTYGPSTSAYVSIGLGLFAALALLVWLLVSLIN